MDAGIAVTQDGAVTTVTISNPAKRNAMSRAMWRSLQAAFVAIQADPGVRCVLVRGAGSHFCAGGDIAEYPDFRFDAAALRRFHEDEVWGALSALLDCDVPVLAQIEGVCMGAGLEIASTCDLRLAGDTARFGAPIARLGFPMAPREAALVASAVGDTTARAMLLAAQVFSATQMAQQGFVTALLPAGDVAAGAQAMAQRVAALAPQAARLNKQTLRTLRQGQTLAHPYAYADSAEHREGIAAFLAKRTPDFNADFHTDSSSGPSLQDFSAMPTPAPHANLYAALRSGFPQDLQAVAVETDHGLHYSWQDLEEASAMVANLLESLDLPAGARVAAQVEKSVEALILYLATLRAGLVYLPLNTAYQSAEMAYFLEDAKPAVVVCKGSNRGWIAQLAFSAGTAYVFTLNEDRTGSLLERAARMPRQHTVAPCAPDALAAIIYTSGTTGRSKGAMLSHGNLLSNAQVLHTAWGWRTPEQGADVLVHALPIFHVHGLFVAIHGALLSGSKMLWMSRFDARTALRHFARATVFMGVPTLYVRLLAEPGLGPEAVRTMRLFVSGSAPMLLETFRDWQARTGHAILERYGMSETVMLTSNPYFAHQGERRGGTVGPALPGVQLRVVSEDGQALPVGEVGGIQVRGPSVFQGYWNMPEKTAEEFTADGYFKTGDVGYVDALAYVTIVGRSKDLVISGGYNVYPAEIEGYINALPGVAESAVVGVPDADFGEVGVAVVVAKAAAVLEPAAILAALKATLAHFKVPKRCHVVAELPRNAMGKVQKNLLRAQYAGR